MSGALRALAALTFAAAAVIVAAWAITYLTWPFGWDHGAFAWVGDVIVRGGMPYRDAFDVKGPMSFYPSAAVQLVSGRNWWGVRAFDLLLLLATAIVIGRIAARLSGRTAAAGAVLLWVLAYANTGFMNTAQPDAWIAWVMLLALAPILLRMGPATPALLAVAGAAAAVATLLKPHYSAFLLLPLLVVWLEAPERRARLAVPALAGFAAPIAAWLVLAVATGTLGAFTEAVIRFNSAKNSSGLLGALTDSLSYGFLEDPVVLLALPLAAAGVPAVARLDRRAAMVLGGWLVLALPLILLQRPYYAYRLHIVTPALAILGAAAVARFSSPRESGIEPDVGATLAGALLLLGVVTFGRHPLGEIARGVGLLAGRRDPAAHYARYDSWMASAADERRGARFIHDSTPPGVTIFAWNHPAVAFLADRRPAGRFLIETPVSARLDEPLRASYLDSLHGGLSAAPPDVVVTEDTLGAAACLACLPPYAALGERGRVLAAPYRLRHRAGRLVIFTRTP